MSSALNPVDQDRRRWTTTPPRNDGTGLASTGNDRADLYEAEQRLDQIEHELETLDTEAKEADDAAAQAKCAWEAHLAYWTLRLDVEGGRSSGDLRRAMAIANVSEDGVPGKQLYFEMVATQSVLNSLTRSIDVRSKRASPLQTRINGLRKATGVDR